VTSSNGGLALDVGKQHLRLDEATLQAHPALRAYDGRAVILGIRPEDLEDASLEPDSPPDRRLRGMVELREALGSELIVHFTVEGTREALTEDVKELAHDAGVPGEGPALESKGSGALLVGRFGARAAVEEGKPIEVAVDTRSLHFFDAETSEGIYDGKESEKGASA
jgi:multiple sugar transport system ATP-binding protein